MMESGVVARNLESVGPIRVPRVVPNPCFGRRLRRTGWVQPVAPEGGHLAHHPGIHHEPGHFYTHLGSGRSPFFHCGGFKLSPPKHREKR